MTGDDAPERDSKAQSPELIADPQERAEREARNALQQFDVALDMIDLWVRQPERRFKLRPSAILTLHRVALDGLSGYAGNWRPAGIEIEGSQHNPAGAHLVPELIEELCDYVNDNWEQKSALHLSAYVMWRLNWIHPFDDGNGRTSRTVSYVVLCARIGAHLPGRLSIPEQIAANKQPYYDALEAADKSWQAGELDVSIMEQLLSDMLANQLLQAHKSAQEAISGDDQYSTKLH